VFVECGFSKCIASAWRVVRVGQPARDSRSPEIGVRPRFTLSHRFRRPWAPDRQECACLPVDIEGVVGVVDDL
jgi:hypothetical protein